MNENWKSLLRFLLCWTTTLMLEYPFLAALGTHNVSYLLQNFSLTLATHGMAATTMFFCQPRGKGWFHYQRQWAHFLFFLTLFLPLIGAFLGGFLYIFGRHAIPVTPEDNNDDAFYKIPEKAKLKAPPRINWDDYMTASTDCQPLADILALQDNELKRDAIEKLATLATPDSIHILLEHRRNVNPEVRFFITSALNRVKKNFDEDLNAAQLEIKRSGYKDSARLLLAKIYKRYAETGLLDSTTSHAYLRESQHHLEAIIKAGHIELKACLLLLEVLEQLQSWEEALHLTSELEEKYLIENTSALKLKARYYYARQDYAQLSAILSQLMESGDKEASWQATAHWWGVTAPQRAKVDA